MFGFAATNEFYNEQLMTIKSGCYKEQDATTNADVVLTCE
jgi:hypothetical protein